MYFPTLIEFENSGCRGLVAFSGVALTTLEELKFKDYVGLNAIRDFSEFPRLKIPNLKGLSPFTYNAILIALRILDLIGCTSLEAMPDLGMFPSFKEFSLKWMQGVVGIEHRCHWFNCSNYF